MKTTIERLIYLAVIATLAGMVVQAGSLHTALESAVPLAPKDFYEQLKKKGRHPQIIDTRPLTGDEDSDEEGYEDAHVPGAIPMPGCDMANAPLEAQGQIQLGVPTVIVSATGDAKTFAACQAQFARARNLTGGFAAWQEADIPEEDGEYIAPKMGGGGGCL